MRALKKLEPRCGQRCLARGAMGPRRLDSHDRFGRGRRRDRLDARLRLSSGGLGGWAPRLLESRRGPIRSGVKREHRPNRPCRQRDQRCKRDPNDRSDPLPRWRRLDRRVSFRQRRRRRYAARSDKRSSPLEHARADVHWQMPFDLAGPEKCPPFWIGPRLATHHCPTRLFCRRRRAEPSSFRAL
jgi:hypothetical protein